MRKNCFMISFAVAQADQRQCLSIPKQYNHFKFLNPTFLASSLHPWLYSFIGIGSGLGNHENRFSRDEANTSHEKQFLN